jgi:hypothetical protein
MDFNDNEYNYQWHKIGNKLCEELNICRCQRKLKSIVHILYRIYRKINSNSTLTPEEILIVALLDRKGLFTHGINIEYPFINNKEFWEWLISIKDSKYLNDN